MSVISRLMNRGAASVLSTLAFMVAGGTVAMAVTDPCYKNNGTGTCFTPVAIECGDDWTCISSAQGGSIQVTRVRLAAPGEIGTIDLHTTTYTRIWTERACGPQLNTCTMSRPT